MSPGPPVTPLKVSGVIELRSDLVTVATAAALPPGSRVSLAFPSQPADACGGFLGKIVGVERRADGSYTVRVRLHSLPQEARSKLEELSAARRQAPRR